MRKTLTDKLPFVSRKRFDATVAAAVEDRRHYQDMMQDYRLREEKVRNDHAKLLTDLRLVRVQIEYPRPNTDIITFQFQLSGTVFDAFRGDPDFVQLLARMTEDMMRRTPEGREALAGFFSRGYQ